MSQPNETVQLNNIPGLPDFITEEELKQILAALREEVRGQLNTGLSTLATNINSSIGIIDSNIETAIGNANSNTTRNVNAVRDQTTALVNQLDKGLDESLKALDQGIARTAGSVVTGMATVADRINTGLQTTINNNREIVNGVIGSTETNIKRTIDAQTAALNREREVARDAAATIAQRIADSQTNIFTQFRDRLGVAIDRTTDFSDRVGTKLAEIVRDANTAFARALDNAVVKSGQNVDEAIKTADRNTIASLATLNAGLANEVRAIDNQTNVVRDTLIQTVDKQIDNFRIFTEVINQTLETEVSQSIVSIATVVDTQLKTVVNFATQTATQVQLFMAAVAEGIEKTSQELGDASRKMLKDISSCGWSSPEELMDIVAGDGILGDLLAGIFNATTAAFTIGGSATASAEPAIQNAVNAAYKKCLSGNPEPESIAMAVAMGYVSQDLASHYYTNQGLAPDAQFILQQAARKAAPPEAAIKALWRGAITNEQATSITTRNALTQSDFDLMHLASLPLLNGRTAIAASVAGIITDAEATGELKAQGFNDKQISAIRYDSEEHLSPNDIINAYHRGIFDTNTLRKELKKRMYTNDDIDTIIKLSDNIPPPSDIVRFGLKDVWEPEIVSKFQLHAEFTPDFAKYMAMHGYKEEWAKAYWASSWEVPSANQGFEMFQRRIIDDADLNLLLKQKDISLYWRDKLKLLAYNPLTRTDVRRMFELGILDEEGVFNAYLDAGYSPVNARGLTEFTKRYASKDDDSEATELRKLTVSTITRAFVRKLLTKEQAIAELQELKYAENDAKLILSIAEFDMLEKLNNDAKSDQHKRMVSQIRKFIRDGLIDESGAIDKFVALGYDRPVAEAEFKLAQMERQNELDTIFIEYYKKLYADYSIDKETFFRVLSARGFDGREVLTILEEVELVRETRDKRPSVAELVRFVKAGLLEVKGWINEMRGLGYADRYIALYASFNSIDFNPRLFDR